MRALVTPIFPLLILIAANAAYADPEGEMWGHKAGDYFGAVVMANEFKKTACGPYLDIPDSWSDVSYAKQNILKKLPMKYHQEFNAAFNRGYEMDLRRSFSSSISTKDISKCKELASGVKGIIAPRINNW